MRQELTLERIDNPDGHQVCQVDKIHRTIAIQKKKYKTLIHFNESGEIYIQHQKVTKYSPGEIVRC